MRVVVLVINAVISASWLGYLPNVNAAYNKKIIKSGHANELHYFGRTAKGSLRVSSALPGKYSDDVWERIRLGMGLYDATPHYRSVTNLGVDEDVRKPDKNSLLTIPAVRVRLYKFQRHNSKVLKGLLKKSPVPVPNATSRLYYAKNMHNQKNSAALASMLAAKSHNRQLETSGMHKDPLTHIDSVSQCGAVTNKTDSTPRRTGFIQAAFVQSVHGVAQGAATCGKKQRALDAGERKQQESVAAITYTIKAPRSTQQKRVDARVNQQIAWFTKRPSYLQQVAERARPYLYHIVESLSHQQLPLELALLPIVESAYQPTALSPMSAAGLWQFIPSTGRDFNLKQNSHYDERLDVMASTRAAIRFLSSLSNHFDGDWLLALAAYNCGQGTVDNAIKQNRARGLPSDYWSLSLPNETQNYVPRLLALAKIFANPARYRLNVKPIKNEPYFVTVNISRQADLSQLVNKKLKTVAELAELSFEHFSRLNPGYLKPTLAQKGPFRFLMPEVNANYLQQRLGMLVEQDVTTPDAASFLSVNSAEDSESVLSAGRGSFMLAKQSPI